MNNIILSFDYEIYFDGSNHHDALFENTQKILNRSKVYNSKLVFFVDIYYLIKLEEYGLLEPFEKLKNQIKSIIENGHEIQYHLHPHWFSAEYNEKKDIWSFHQTEYSLSDIIRVYGREFAYSKFNLGVSKMKEWFDYQPLAYRAGGLSIDQNQKELIELLKDNNFLFDSSVMPGLYLEGKFIHIDHRAAPQKDNWSIENDFFTEMKPSRSNIMEIPVMTIIKKEIPMVERIITSVQYRAISAVCSKDNSNLKNVGKPFELEITKSLYPISITFDKSKTSDILLLKYFTRAFFKKDTKILCMLSHPKSFLNQSYEVFSTYLMWLDKNKKKYSLSGFADLVKSE